MTFTLAIHPAELYARAEYVPDVPDDVLGICPDCNGTGEQYPDVPHYTFAQRKAMFKPDGACYRCGGKRTIPVAVSDATRAAFKRGADEFAQTAQVAYARYYADLRLYWLANRARLNGVL